MANHPVATRLHFPAAIACILICFGLQPYPFSLNANVLARPVYSEAADKPDNPIALYNTACGVAENGMKESAWACLERAIALGFDMGDFMERDSSLMNLRSDARWKPTLEKVKKKEEIRIHYESLLNDMGEICGLACDYRDAILRTNIRRDTYEGFHLSKLLVAESEGNITVNAVSKDTMNFTMVSKEGHGTINFSLRSEWAKPIHIWQKTGDFAALSPYLDNVERKRHRKFFDRVEAFKERVEVYKDSSDHYDLPVLLRNIPGLLDTLDVYIHSESSFGQQTAIGIASNTTPINDRLVDILVWAKDAYNTGLRSEAIEALERAGLSHPKVLPALIEFADLDWNRSARNAIGKLCIAEKDSVPMLLLVLKYSEYNGDWAVRLLDSMNCSDPRIVRGLIEALHNESDIVRKNAAEALGHRSILLDEIFPALASALADSESIVRYGATESLLKFGQKGTSVLIQCLKSKDIYTRTSAVEALERITPVTHEIEEAFIQCLKDSNSDVCETAAAVLSRLKTPESRKALEVYKQDEKRREEEYDKEYQAHESRLFSLNDIFSDIPPNADYREALHIRDSVPVTVKNDTLFFLTVHTDRDRPDQLNIWKKYNQGFRHIDTFESEGGDYHGDFDKPVVFHLNGETFIYIQINSGGNGGYHDDSMYVITERKELRHVEFIRVDKQCNNLLKEGETIMNGVDNTIADDTLSFFLGIWEKDDAHCCPTGGSIEGTYKLEKIKTYDPILRREKVSYRIVVGDYSRVPAKKEKGE